MSVASMATEMENAPQIRPYKMIRGHTNDVRGVAHLRDKQEIITCSYDGSLRLWDRESGIQIGNDWRDDGDKVLGVGAIALSPNGKTVAIGCRDGMVKLWDIETRKITAKWIGHTSHMYSVCWSADGERVASGSWDGTVGVWDVESGKTVLGPIKTGEQQVWAVAYSPDASKIATSGDKAIVINVWDARTGELLSTIEQEAYSLAWTSDQKKLIAGCDDLIRIFDTTTWQQIAVLAENTNLIPAISLFNDRLLASGSWDDTARLWNLDTNLQIGPSLKHRNWVRDVTFSTDGKFLVTACDDNKVYVWDIGSILKDAGFEDLLSIPNVTDVESTLESDASGQQTEFEDAQSHLRDSFGSARESVQSFTPHVVPPVTVHPDRPRSIAPTNSLASTTHVNPPASTSCGKSPTSTSYADPPAYRRYDGSRARALFSRYVPRLRPSRPNMIEPMELQQQSSQRIISIDGPVESPTLWARFTFFIPCVRRTRTQKTHNNSDGGP